jgi:hypothetical protein
MFWSLIVLFFFSQFQTREEIKRKQEHEQREKQRENERIKMERERRVSLQYSLVYENDTSSYSLWTICSRWICLHSVAIFTVEAIMEF